MLSSKVAVRTATLSSLLLVLVLWIGCSSTVSESAAPTFCPTKYAVTLPTPLAAENIPPQAYYQNVLTVQDQPVDIILYACDPDNPATSEGLTWRADQLPGNGLLSIDFGAYPDEGVVTYTPRAGYVGTDSIQYVVDDGEGEGNIATIEITVNPPQATATSLYFGGWDDVGVFNLWSYNGGSGLMTVPNSAAVLASGQTSYDLFQQTIFDGDLYLMGDRGDGGAIVYAYNSSSGLATRSSGHYYGSNFAILDNILYVGLSGSNDDGYLWATDGSSSVYTIPTTAGLGINNMAAFSGSLFFDGNDTISKQLWVRSGAGTVSTLSSISSGITFATGLNPDSFTVFNNELYFAGNMEPSGRALWKSSSAGVLSTVGNFTMSFMYDTSRLAVFGSVLCVNGMAPGDVSQLWTYHATNGFNRVTSNSTYDVDPRFMIPFNGQLVFAGSDDTGQNHLMYTDGTSVGIVPNTAGMNPSFITLYDGMLYFSAGNYPDIQLWYTTDTLNSPSPQSLISTSNGAGGLYPTGLIVY